MDHGPGTRLAELLRSVNIRVVDDCECEEWIDKMNAWGPTCIDHRQEIIDRLRDKAATINPIKLAWTGALIVWGGTVPTIGALVDRAIAVDVGNVPDP